MLAVQVKRKAPTAHTFLEIVRARWGTQAHLVFMVFGFVTNLLVTSMLILGGSAVVNALTGMNTDVASILIPPSVVMYTLAGGLKATFVASYLHTVIIMVALCMFMFMVYADSNSSLLGSPRMVWERLLFVADIDPVAGNRDGSHLTMFSTGGLMFGIINIVGNFGAVFVDQAYWQSAVAATPSASWKGYILGGLCWFSIPFTLATSLGLAANALSLPVTVAEADEGLVPAATAVYLMGSGGAMLIRVMLFMAITSSASGEQIAVSSLVAFDVYRTYLKPRATGDSIIRVSRWTIFVFGMLMGPMAVALHHAGIGLNWLYLFMGVLIGAAVFPVAFSISWIKCSREGAIAGALLGTLAGIGSWLLAARSFGGVVTIATLGTDEAMLVGNLVSLLGSGVICVVVSLLRPDRVATWETTTMKIMLVEEDANAHNSTETEEALDAAMKKIIVWGISLTLLFIIIWPLLTLAAGNFSLGFFTFWVVLSMAWGLVASAVIVLLPLWEYRGELLDVVLRMLRSKGEAYTLPQQATGPQASPAVAQEHIGLDGLGKASLGAGSLAGVERVDSGLAIASTEFPISGPVPAAVPGLGRVAETSPLLDDDES